jgi:hypothetical protein
VLSVGPKEEALKKDPRGVWGTAACWQHLDRTSDTSTVGSTQQRCVSRRFVKFVRLCAGPSSSSLLVLAAALHCFRSLSRPDSLSLSVSLPPSSPDSSNLKSYFCCQKHMGREGSHIACPRGFWQIFFLFLGSPSSSESSCSLFWFCFVVETTDEFLYLLKPPQLQLQWLTSCCIACGFLALSSSGMCTRRRVFSSSSVMLRRSSAGPSSSSCVLAPLTKEEIPLACLNRLRFLRFLYCVFVSGFQRSLQWWRSSSLKAFRISVTEIRLRSSTVGFSNSWEPTTVVFQLLPDREISLQNP